MKLFFFFCFLKRERLFCFVLFLRNVKTYILFCVSVWFWKNIFLRNINLFHLFNNKVGDITEEPYSTLLFSIRFVGCI